MGISKLSEYDMIIFDCDGVLMDTNVLKVKAFGDSIEGYPKNIVDSFVIHCKNTFGISRYKKFEDFFELFAKEQFNKERYEKFLKNYSNLCKKLYSEADITPGVIELLEKLKAERKEVYVASGSDENELQGVFRERGLSTYFNNIYGSPTPKSSIINFILTTEHKKALLIGDAKADLKAAKTNNIDFAFMEQFSVQSDEDNLLCKKEANFVIGTLKELI